ncbi:hypothetical protein CHUAL_008427 [Chamberlinius hualienensis]
MSRRINHIAFNQDHSIFTCSLDSGLKVFNVEPLNEQLYLHEALVGSVTHCQMMFRSNLIAFVTGGALSKYAENTVIIWDESLRKLVLEYTFSEAVLNIRLLSDKIIVVLPTLIHVFAFPKPPVKLFSIETRINHKGICEVSSSTTSDKQIMAFPSVAKIGHVQIIDLKATKSSSPVTIAAHENEIACLALNPNGSLVATASQKGTLIRIYNTKNKSRLLELRRGVGEASIYSINFKADSEWLCCSSDKGTIHIFALKDTHLNRTSVFSNFGFGRSSYVGGMWSMVSISSKDTDTSNSKERFCICAFGENSFIYAIYADGTFKKFMYFPSNRSASQRLNENILDIFNE